MMESYTTVVELTIWLEGKDLPAGAKQISATWFIPETAPNLRIRSAIAIQKAITLSARRRKSREDWSTNVCCASAMRRLRRRCPSTVRGNDRSLTLLILLICCLLLHTEFHVEGNAC